MKIHKNVKDNMKRKYLNLINLINPRLNRRFFIILREKVGINKQKNRIYKKTYLVF